MAITVNIKGGNVQLSDNPIEIECSGAVAPAGSSDYKILFKVISSDLFGAPFEDAKSPDSTGKATFNISAYADQPVRKVFQYPVAGVYVEYDSQAFHVQVQAGEYWLDENGVINEVWGAVNATEITILKGGTNPRQISAMAGIGTSFFDLYVAGNKWLTTRSWGDQIHPDQHVKLWFIVNEAKSATLNVRTTYSDGSNQLFTSAAVNMITGKLYEFNCNPSLHGVSLENEAGSKAYFMDAWLDFSGTLSESRRFHFDWRYIQRPVFLFFANSLGGIDDVYFSGVVKEKFESEGATAEFPYRTSDTVFDATLQPSGKVGQNVYVMNTGYKGDSTQIFYRDLLLAKQVWHLYYNNQHVPAFIVPVLPEVGSYDIISWKDDLYAAEITFREAQKSAYNFDNRLF